MRLHVGDTAILGREIAQNCAGFPQFKLAIDDRRDFANGVNVGVGSLAVFACLHVEQDEFVFDTEFFEIPLND